ncbi:alpha/beta hydrolase [Duganella aquatilis]|uniref:alpha/beta hydrolase n=1 Tax=Duganella aquatilis TaxID=2666082 RepID=UPI001AA04E40|nr:hypothetical protein [Duganella aquatilis]
MQLPHHAQGAARAAGCATHHPAGTLQGQGIEYRSGQDHLCRPGGKFDGSIRVTAKTPPTFLLQAWDDPVDPVCISLLYAEALDHAGVPAEVHLFAKGGHAFGLRDKDHPISSWPSLVENWLKDIGVLKAL